MSAVMDRFPPNVRLPLVVTVPVSVKPDTVPVPLTLVTVPLDPEPLLAAVSRPCASTVMLALVYEPAVTVVFAKDKVPDVVIGPPVKPVPDATDVTVPVVLDVPAPMAVRNVAASKEETVLSALKRGKAIAATLATVNKLPPRVVAPKFVRAAAAVVAPVPPFATATVPVTLDDVPVVFWFSVGTSAATIARNVGTPATPLGAARKVLAVCEAKLEGVTARVPPKVRFPLVVTVPLKDKPLTVPVPPTLVTVPPLLVSVQGTLTTP